MDKDKWLALGLAVGIGVEVALNEDGHPHTPEEIERLDPPIGRLAMVAVTSVTSAYVIAVAPGGEIPKN